MNQNQKTVIFIALILLLCCGIFVPYDGVRTENEKVTELFLGYFPIFDPPVKGWNMIKSFYKGDGLKGEALERQTHWAFNSTYTQSVTYKSNINLLRLIIEILFLLIITIGLIFIFSDSKPKEKPTSNKEV